MAGTLARLYRVRLDSDEMAKLQMLAKKRKQPSAAILRDLIRFA